MSTPCWNVQLHKSSNYWSRNIIHFICTPIPPPLHPPKRCTVTLYWCTKAVTFTPTSQPQLRKISVNLTTCACSVLLSLSCARLLLSPSPLSPRSHPLRLVLPLSQPLTNSSLKPLHSLSSALLMGFTPGPGPREKSLPLFGLALSARSQARHEDGQSLPSATKTPQHVRHGHSGRSVNGGEAHTRKWGRKKEKKFQTHSLSCGRKAGCGCGRSSGFSRFCV